MKPDKNTTHDKLFSMILFVILCLCAFIHIYGIDKLVLNSDELHPARAIVGEDWSLKHSSWPTVAEREYYDNWPVQFPPLFGILTRGSVNIFGKNHFALRIWPVLFSIGAVWIGWFLFTRRMSKQFVILSTLLLGIISDKLIYYAKFFKHYTADVLLSTLLILLTLNLLKKDRWSAWLALVLTSSAGIWLGFASVFVSGSCFFILFLSRLKNKGLFPKTFLKTGVAIFFFILSFLLLFKFTIANAVNNQIFINEWQMQIFDISEIDNFKYVVHFLGRIFYHILLLPHYFFFDSTVVAIFANILILLWIFIKIKTNNLHDILLTLMPLGLAIIASLLGKYPFSAGRLSLFLLPLWILMITESIQNIYDYLKTRRILFTYLINLILIICITSGTYINVNNVLKYRYAGGRRVDLLFKTLKEKAKGNDTVFLYWGAILPFYFYFTDHGKGFCNKYPIPGSCQDSIKVIYGEERSLSGNYDTMYKRLDSINGRIWLCFCHLWPDENMIALIDYMDQAKNKIEENTFKGCKLFLYEPYPQESVKQ